MLSSKGSAVVLKSILRETVRVLYRVDVELVVVVRVLYRVGVELVEVVACHVELAQVDLRAVLEVVDADDAARLREGAVHLLGDVGLLDGRVRDVVYRGLRSTWRGGAARAPPLGGSATRAEIALF